MILQIPTHVLAQIQSHGEASYPEEGAGLLLGTDDHGHRQVVAILALDNAREETARHNRYLLTPQDMLKGELEADRRGLDVIGVFHSHPDHSNQPSDFDRQWALPWFTYVITSVHQGKASGSRAWRLVDDRSQFVEEPLTTDLTAENFDKPQGA